MRSTIKFVLFLSILAIAAGAQAQATRTWVSGVGDDVNPCSRTAPCKTFAGAISKTASGGEINVIDPGGYGAVTITKPITIDGFGPMASILNPGSNGIVINTAGTVTLRNLEINGAGTGVRGISVTNVGKLIIDNVRIYGQGGSLPGGQGINLNSTAGTMIVSIRNSRIDTNTEHGIFATASGGGIVALVVEQTIIESNGASGIELNGGAKLVLSNSHINLNNGSGVSIDAASCDADIAHSYINFNSVGLTAIGGSARLFNTQLTHNGNSISTASGGQVQTQSNNAVINNSIQTLPSPNVSQQ